MLDKIEPLHKSLEVLMAYNKARVEIECPVCHNTDWETLDHLRRPIDNSHLCICKQCGFISYNPQLKNIKQWYISEPRPQSVDFMNTKATKLEKHKKILTEILNDNLSESGRVLDYGCSDGYLLKMLQEEYDIVNCTGIELNPGHANWAKFMSGLDVTMDDDLSRFEDAAFDFIICYHVLEHIQQPEKLLAEFNRILSTDGMLYIGLPTLSRMDYPSREILFKEEHINWWTDETLIQFLALNGFRVIHSNYNLYGTAVILKKCKPLDKIKNYYTDNSLLLSKIHECYNFRSKLEEAMGKGDINAGRHFAIKALEQTNVFPELIIKYSSIHDPIDEQDILNGYLEKHPGFWELYLALGLSYFKDGDLDKAEQCLLKTIEISGKSGMALLNLGQIKFHQRDPLAAIKYFKECLELEPYNMSCLEMLTALLMKM